MLTACHSCCCALGEDEDEADFGSGSSDDDEMEEPQEDAMAQPCVSPTAQSADASFDDYPQVCWLECNGFVLWIPNYHVRARNITSVQPDILLFGIFQR